MYIFINARLLYKYILRCCFQMLTEHVNIDVSSLVKIAIRSKKWCLKNSVLGQFYALKIFASYFRWNYPTLKNHLPCNINFFLWFINCWSWIDNRNLIDFLSQYNKCPITTLLDWHMPNSPLYTKGTHCFRVKPQSRTLYFHSL